jgi:hypothetical protein
MNASGIDRIVDTIELGEVPVACGRNTGSQKGRIQRYSRITTFACLLLIASLSLERSQMLPHVAEALIMFADRVFSWIGDFSEAGFDKSNPAFSPCQPPRKIMHKFGLAGCYVGRSFFVPFDPTLVPDMQTVTIGAWINHDVFVVRNIDCVPHG